MRSTDARRGAALEEQQREEKEEEELFLPMADDCAALHRCRCCCRLAAAAAAAALEGIDVAPAERQTLRVAPAVLMGINCLTRREREGVEKVLLLRFFFSDRERQADDDVSMSELDLLEIQAKLANFRSNQA